MLSNTQLGLLFLVITTLIIVTYRMTRKENYGVFSHRGTLHGINAGTRNFYSLDELKYQYPINYWNYKTCNDRKCSGCDVCKKRALGAMSIYDQDIQSYHAKRFDPKLIM